MTLSPKRRTRAVARYSPGLKRAEAKGITMDADKLDNQRRCRRCKHLDARHAFINIRSGLWECFVKGCGCRVSRQYRDNERNG